MIIALQTLLPLGHVFDSYKPSQLPVCSPPSSFNPKNHLCPHRYPFTAGWREAIIVKCLAQGHMCHDLGSNPQSDDSATRT